ncbi:unnamed protein product, partial [Ectocarpus fasciculatus]
MASATSEGYCNHLRGQLKEWERAFRSRNGRFPKQRDFEALDSDASARGRLVHTAYLALNRATGDSFTKSLATRESTRNMVIIGGPRKSAAERNNGGTLGSAQSFRRSSGSSGSGSSNNGRNRPGVEEDGGGGGGGGGGKHSNGGPMKSNSISQHLDIMERLRAKVQPRSGSSLAAPLAQGKAGQQRPKVNSVLAAGDGHRRSGRGAGLISKNRLERSSNGAAGAHVSSRARAMGITATATKEPAGAAAVTKPERNPPSSLARGENSKGGVPRLGAPSRSAGGAGCGGGSSEGRGGVGGGRSALGRPCSSNGEEGVHAPNGEHHESDRKDLAAAAVPPSSAGIRARECAGGVGTRDVGKPGGGANGDSDGATASGSSSRSTSNNSSAFYDYEGQGGVREDGVPPEPERELIPERRATRRVGGAARGDRRAVPGASRSNGLQSFRADFGRGVVTKKSRATGGRLGRGVSSAGAIGCSTGGAGPGRQGKGSATATAAAGDEAGLAVAMMDILQSSGSMLSGNTNPAGASRVGDGSRDGRGDAAAAAAASGLLPTAASIVNTVGGGGGGAGASFGSSSLPHSSGVLGAPAMTGAKKARPAAVVAKAVGNTADGAAAICGPGLVASSCSSGPRRTGGGGTGVEEDWRLRASRAVGRVREEEEAGDAASAAAAAAAAAAKAAGAVADGGGSEGTPHRGTSPTPTSTTPQSPQGPRVTGSGNATSTVGREAIIPSNKQASAIPSSGAGRISDSDEDGGGGDSDWSLGGGGGTSASSTTLRGKTQAAAYVRDHEGDPASARARRASTAGAQPAPGGVPSSRAVGGRKKAKSVKKTTEVSDNFVRADLKSRGSSRFKRKGSLRSKARGGSGGRGFGGGGGG